MFNRLILALSLLLPGLASAQGGIEVPVGGEVTLFQMAVPEALRTGGPPDTRGITEALTGTIKRDFAITGIFNLIDPAAYPNEKGMDPTFKDWFNIGAQGLVKAGFAVNGDNVVVDLRLYTVDGGRRVLLPAPYAQPTTLPIDAGKLRAHAHGFVNEVIKHFTKAPGFFGTKLVVVKRVGKGKELFMIGSDGLDEVQLTRTGGINMLPSFRGSVIYFTSFRNGGAHLFKLQGGQVSPFTSFKGLNTGAALSPAGNAVAATLSKDGNPEVYLLDPNSGKTVRRLTDNWGIDTSPSWSPDGKQLAFVSDRHGSPHIWLMNADGSNQRRITFQGEYNQTPEWSPRGDLIVFTGRDERNVFDLFTVEVATGNIRRLTQNQGNNEEPTFSPDGRYIAFTSTRNGPSQLFIATADGRVQTQVTKGSGQYMTPSWHK